MLVSLLAARHRTIKEMKSKFDFPLKDIEDAVLLSKLVAYCSKLVSALVHMYESTTSIVQKPSYISILFLKMGNDIVAIVA